jgi:hypothetical protein
VQLGLFHGHALRLVHGDAPGQVERQLGALGHHLPAQRHREGLVADDALRAVNELHQRNIGFAANANQSDSKSRIFGRREKY